MSIRRDVLCKHLLPRPGNVALLAAAVGILVIGLACSFFFSITTDMDDPQGVAAVALGVFAIPATVLLAIIATFRDKRPAPRAVLWFVSAVLIAFGGLIVAIAMANDPDMGIASSGIVYAAICMPATLVLFVPSAYFGRKAWPILKDAYREQRETASRAFIASHGRATFSEIAEVADLDLESVEGMLKTLYSGRRQKATVYPEHMLLFSERALNQGLRRMQAILAARGQIYVDELACELDVPQDVLKDWLYHLVQEERFSGYANWDEGTLYSEEADKLQDAGRCPHCGGEMQLAGKGVIRCPYCGSEVFV